MEKKRLGLRIPTKISKFLTEYAYRTGLTQNAIVVEVLWKWRCSLNRQELVKMFGEEELAELEASMYDERITTN